MKSQMPQLINFFRTICNAAGSRKSFRLLNVKHFQNIHSYHKMLFRVCHASMMQACNKKYFEETTLVEMKVSLKMKEWFIAEV